VIRSLALCTIAVLLGAGFPGQAAEGEAARLRRALERVSAGRAPRAGIRGLARFEAEVDARRAAFRAAGRLRLPPKAAERLGRARAAYEAGHGRLLDLLRRLDDDAAALPEAKELAARIEEAERREPYSGELRVRAPRLQAAALPAGDAAAASDTVTAAAATTSDARPIGPVPATLRGLAADLGGALEIYSFVRNGVASELYYGRLKGSVETYLEKSGNDADTAALLVDLLRARGIPARYVIGTAEVPSATLLRLVGTASRVEDAVRALERAGIPHEPVLAAGGISAVRMARVWVEAYLPYINYRGLEIDAQGKAWVPLDAAFKLHDPPSGLDVISELGFDPRAAFDEYLAAPRVETPREFLRARVEARLAARRPGLTFEQVLASRRAAGESLGLLPNTLPYAATRAEVSYSLPDALIHRVRVRAEAGGVTILDHPLDTADLLANRVTIGFEPFDDDDRAVVALFGSMRQTPPYLFEVRPVLRLGGVAAAAGEAIGFGVKYTLRLDLTTPSGAETVTTTLLAGNLTAIGFGGRSGTASDVQDDEAAQILAGIASRYLERWNASDAELSGLLRVVPIRPTLSACVAMSDVEVQYAGGDPLYPLTFEWKGVAIDADFRPMAPVGIETRAREREFALLSGLEGAVLEARVLTDALQVESVSTVTALQLAPAQGVGVVDVTAANVDAVVPGLPFDATVKEEIRAAAEGGRSARVPLAPVSRLAWTGVGYLLLDEETGEAAYQLQGGHSGGVTAPAVDGFPPSVREILTEQRNETPVCPNRTEAEPASLAPESDTILLGVVDQKLDETVRVFVKDAEGNLIPQACVTFTVTVGGGKLVLPLTEAEGDQVTVRADDSGIAAVGYRLGKSTRQVPRFFCEDGRSCEGEDGDEFTQVGMNQVTARAGAARLPEPFTFFALPDGRCAGGLGGSCQAELALTTPSFRTGAFNLSVAALMAVAVTDLHGNPLSNFDVRFAAQPRPEVAPPPAGQSLYRPQGTETPGKVLKPADYGRCLQDDVIPGLGDCPGEAEAVAVRSSPSGAFAYAVVGDSPYSYYRFDIGSSEDPNRLLVTVGTAGYLCLSPVRENCPDADEPTTIVFHGTRPRRVNRHGDFIEAYPAGDSADLTVWAVSIEEGNTVSEYGQPDERGPKFRARGDNTYTRKRLDDSVFTGRPTTGGTGVDPAVAPHVGNGNYRAQMRTSTSPQENVVRFDAAHRPPVIRYLREFQSVDPDDRFRVAPAYVDLAAGKAVRAPSVPWRGGIDFPLWGGKVTIPRVAPESILVADAEVPTTAHSVQVFHKIEPEAWRRLLDPWLVFFTVRSASDQIVVATRAGDEFSLPTSDRFSIPRGVPLPPGDYRVHLEVQAVARNSIGTAGSGIEAQPRPIRAGRVNLVTDANNDTLVDAADEALLRVQPGATLQFWEGDPTRTEQADSGAEENPLHILEEYVTLRITLDENLPPDERLFLRLSGAGQALHLVNHVGSFGTACGSKSYLCDMTAATVQAERRSSEMRSIDGVAPLPDRLFMVSGANDFIYRCSPDQPRGSAEPCSGVLELLRDVDGVKETLVERNVRFRPIEKLMTVYSARMPDDPAVVAPVAQRLANWAELPPVAEAPRIFMFVHGYNVPLEGALSHWFPLVFKRFYWVGLPLIKEQKSEPQDRFHMVGFTWPGNEGRILPFIFETSPYPPNEFNAMQSGVPLAVLLTDRSQGFKVREVQVMAHSLGNMVVSEAISMIPGQTVKRYIMNDAAVAAEAYANSAYQPAGLEVTELGPTAVKWGFPDDAQPALGDWVSQWRAIVAESRIPSTACGGSGEFPPFGPSDFERWNTAKADLATINADVPSPAYDRRWRLFPETFSAWTGVYKDVPVKTRLVNTYNPNDGVINLQGFLSFSAWELVQLRLKPYVGLLGLAHDNRCTMYWAPLRDQDAAQQNDVWAQGRSWTDIVVDRLPAAIGRLTRRWAERAYWFAARSGAAGAQQLRQTSTGVEHRSFEAEGRDHHNYLFRERALPPLWSAYGYLKETLEKP
jgi:hypothetical protein